MFEFRKSKYKVDNSLAIIVYENNEPYSKLTVCAYPDVRTEDYKQFININAFGNDKIIKKLEEEGKIIKTGINWKNVDSFVTYPLYEFNKEWVDSLKED